MSSGMPSDHGGILLGHIFTVLAVLGTWNQNKIDCQYSKDFWDQPRVVLHHMLKPFLFSRAWW